jgi:mono/diheme cytochrome c family protein
MDDQEKYKPQAESGYFADGRTMRTPVEGTVARNELFKESSYYQGKNENNDFIENSPVDVDNQLLERGKRRYNVYCTPCHNVNGDGKGIIISKGFLPPPDFHQDKYREYPDGQIYDVITNGFRNMPDYKHQIPVNDRWAIVAYVRKLQMEHEKKQILSNNSK